MSKNSGKCEFSSFRTKMAAEHEAARDPLVSEDNFPTCYNSYVRRREGDLKRESRNKARESPLPIYVGTAIHAKTRSPELVDTFHRLGISI